MFSTVELSNFAVFDTSPTRFVLSKRDRVGTMIATGGQCPRGPAFKGQSLCPFLFADAP